MEINERERLNKHLVAAREGIAMMAGYPDGEPDPEDVGTVLVSSDPRITRIIDLGGNAYIEYAFTTKDGPRRMTANMPLDGVAELVGLSAEERNAQVVKMIESSVDIVEAGGVGGPCPDDPYATLWGVLVHQDAPQAKWTLSAPGPDGPRRFDGGCCSRR